MPVRDKHVGMLASALDLILCMRCYTFVPTETICITFVKASGLTTPDSTKIGFRWDGGLALRAGLKSNMVERDGKKIELIDTIVALHVLKMYYERYQSNRRLNRPHPAKAVFLGR